MGPQLDSCGRPMDCFTLSWTWRVLQWGRNLIVAEGGEKAKVENSVRLLQWGRNLIVAEGVLGLVLNAESDLLQWGRNLIVAEGTKQKAPTTTHRTSFNGAAT